MKSPRAGRRRRSGNARTSSPRFARYIRRQVSTTIFSWGSLRLPGVGIEFNLGDDEEVECLSKHVRGGDPAPQVVAHILSWECAQSPPARRADYFDLDPVS